MKNILLLLPLLLLAHLGFGQTKFEQEFRIDKDEVPIQARTFVESLNFNKKIKWYKEVGNNRTSVEAKTKYQGQWYSIEFSPDGTLEDVEIKIDWCEIPKVPRLKIVDYLEKKYAKFSVDKVQVQYVEQKDFLAFYAQKKGEIENIKCNFEIMVAAKVNNTYQQYEYLFSGTGAFLKASKVVLKNSNNIEY